MSRLVRALVFSLSIFSTTLALAQVNFTPTVIPSGDSGSGGIVSADFNNDGIFDLVTANTSTVSFYKGLGGGKYANPISQKVPANNGTIVAADFSRHGTPDLAIGSATSGLIILIGNNNGTFHQGTNLDTGGFVQFMTMADFNGDHLPDLAVSVCRQPFQGPCDSKVYLGEGNGRFRLAATLVDGGGEILAGDFNADGHQDIIVNAGNQVVLYLGNGNGTFKAPILASLANVVDMAIGDFYSNRIQSVVAVTQDLNNFPNFQSWLYTLRYSNGHLLVENQRILQESAGVPYTQITAGDLNGDFKDDIFLIGFDSNGTFAQYLLGNGNGTFGQIFDSPSGVDGPSFSFIRDLDGDSRHDIALGGSEIFDATGVAEILHNTSAIPNCSLPPAGQLNVHICAPAHNGQVVGQTFTFRGSGSALNGIAKRMELWIDGRKVAQNLEDQLKATVRLARGNHIASFVVVDSFDSHVAGSVSFKAEF